VALVRTGVTSQKTAFFKVYRLEIYSAATEYIKTFSVLYTGLFML
jgi:hypothetical protein